MDWAIVVLTAITGAVGLAGIRRYAAVCQDDRQV